MIAFLRIGLIGCVFALGALSGLSGGGNARPFDFRFEPGGRADRILPQAQAIYDAFSAAGAAADATQQAAINTLVNDLIVSGNWWSYDSLYVSYALADAQARINWIAPSTSSWNLTNNGSPTFTAKAGFSNPSSGSNGLVNAVNFSALARYTLNSAQQCIWLTAGARVNNSVSGTQAALGNASFIVANRSSSDVVRYRINDSTSSDSAANITTPIGFTCTARPDNANKQVYKDGFLNATSAVASTSVLAKPLALLYDVDTGVGVNQTIGVHTLGQATASFRVYAAYKAFQKYMAALP